MNLFNRIRIDLSTKDARHFLNGMEFAKKSRPELISKSEPKAKYSFEVLRHSDKKRCFRATLIAGLRHSWTAVFGPRTAQGLFATLLSTERALSKAGAITFGPFIDLNRFRTFVSEYRELMSKHGSCTPLHRYLSLREHPDFFASPLFQNALLNPFLLTLISLRMGGVIRVVDARCKDTEPLDANVQDNMLHIDNTPFREEFKIILMWQKDTVVGPWGQNLVYLPGTHLGIRNCFKSGSSGSWLTENNSIFTDRTSVNQLFRFQKRVTSYSTRTVIQVQDKLRPLTTVFEAGSLVHHRYRSNEGQPRSCAIIAFHSACEHPGSFLFGAKSGELDNLRRSVLFGQNCILEQEFLAGLFDNATAIGLEILRLASESSLCSPLSENILRITGPEMQRWFSKVTAGPELEDIKQPRQKRFLGSSFPTHEVLTVIARDMMGFDKHGPLDLALYDDNREESRKWARNRIREMDFMEMRKRLSKWKTALDQPSLEHILLPKNVGDMATHLIGFAAQLKGFRMSRPSWVGISSCMGIKSLQRLIIDIKEAIYRCHSPQNFLSTSLFLFWVCDELCECWPTNPQRPKRRLEEIGMGLLRHYLSLAVAVGRTAKRQMH